MDDPVIKAITLIRVMDDIGLSFIEYAIKYEKQRREEKNGKRNET